MGDAERGTVADTGYYGKLPGYGDFLRRRLPDEFVHPWDEWLQRAFVASRQSLGEGWLPAYLTSPVWRFAVSGGAGAPQTWAGVVVPSVDRVGRYFPFCVAARLAPDVSLHRCAALATAWFDAIEAMACAALEEERTDLDKLDAELQAASTHLPTDAHMTSAAVTVPGEGDLGRPQWRGNAGSVADVGLAMLDTFSAFVSGRFRPLSLWWTDGSARVSPTWLMARGLPEPDAYAAMLTGEWSADHWLDWAPQPPRTPLAMQTFKSFAVTSAGATDVGRVRRQNQDAYLVAATAGIFAVADGVGGHAHGEIASGMVVDALAGLPPAASLEGVVEPARAALRDVNRLLRTRTGDQPGETTAGSTVVMLAVRGGDAAVLWAGDSRLYLYRAGRLEAITRDHTAEPAPADSTLPRTATAGEITRAVGGDEVLDLDVQYFSLAAGDRLLLCSDGVYSEISAQQLTQGLSRESADAACTAIMDDVGRSPARDNASAVVVYVD